MQRARGPEALYIAGAKATGRASEASALQAMESGIARRGWGPKEEAGEGRETEAELAGEKSGSGQQRMARMARL